MATEDLIKTLCYDQGWDFFKDLCYYLSESSTADHF